MEAIQGLYYIENVPLQESEILAFLAKEEWKPVTDAAHSREYIHYGFTYDYHTRTIGDPLEPIPEALESCKRIIMEYCLQENLIDPSHEFNQCIINKYEPGQGINKHIDIKAYGPVIGCFTFGSGAVMTFRRKDEVHHLYVKPNSLYIMSGESRLLWTHEMPSRKSDMVEGKRIPRGQRISVTFRHVPK